MPTRSRLRHAYLSYLSSPPSERCLYRIACRERFGRILEIGVGTCRRATRLIQVAVDRLSERQVQYTGIDLFEDRPSHNPGVTLRQAYRLLKPLGAGVQLVPGDPCWALARIANSLSPVDLVVISSDQDAESLARAWLFVPRILHHGSHVLVQRTDMGRTG